MTEAKAHNEVFIDFASSNLAPLLNIIDKIIYIAAVFFTLSEPARSINDNLE